MKQLIIHEDQLRALEKIGAYTAAHIIGIDEVGLGCWAGPVVVAAAVMPRDWRDPLVQDSKALSARQRERADVIVRSASLMHCILPADNQEVDALGISYIREVLTRGAASICLKYFPDALVVQDGDLPVLLNEASASQLVWLPKADVLVPAVSAASVVAKVYRDAFMRVQAKVYPGYGFETNVGYGSKKHIMGLDKLGVCPLHRRSYKPIKKYLGTPHSGKLGAEWLAKQKEMRDLIDSRVQLMRGPIKTIND